MIHILLHGLPLCHTESQLGVPREWPKDHKWVTVEESDQADCPACKKVNRDRHHQHRRKR